jgi:hypothetical protein
MARLPQWRQGFGLRSLVSNSPLAFMAVLQVPLLEGAGFEAGPVIRSTKFAMLTYRAGSHLFWKIVAIYEQY